MSKTIINVYSHNFSVSRMNPAMVRVVNKAASWFDEYSWENKNGQWVKEWSKSWAWASDDGKLFRFHINVLPEFRKLLEREGVPHDDYEIIIEPDYEPERVVLKVKSHIKPYEDQVPILEQVYQPEPVSKLLGLQTGGGKSLMSILNAAFFGYRSVFIMKAGYVTKWVGDIMMALDIDPSEIEEIGGSAQLMRLIDGIDRGLLSPSIVLISNTTYRNWISEQEDLPAGQLVPGFACTPAEFMQHCGFGFRVIDEVHQDFHFNFILDLHTHVAQSLSLSATLITRDPWLEKMHKMAYPAANRCRVPEYKKYIDLAVWFYDFIDSRSIKTSARGRTSYSHVEFEKSIMRSPRLKKMYFIMVYDAMRKTFMVGKNQGERCLIYFATKQMCFEAKHFFKQLLPDYKIEKFNQGDPYENLLTSDISFATLIKAGTAVDVPWLTTVINTIAIDSIQANDQALGRCRDIRKLYKINRNPVHMYFVCTNFQKHIQYHKSKQELFKNKVLNTTEMRYNISLG